MQSPPTTKRCPVPSQPHTFTFPFIKSRLLRLQVVTTGSHHGPRAHAGRRIMHWFLSTVTQQSALSSVQRPVPLLLTCREWPLWQLTSSVTACVALHFTGWLAALSNCIGLLLACYCPVTGTVKVWIASRFSENTSLCKNWLRPNMWRSKRKAYMDWKHLKREKNGQTAQCKMYQSVLTLLAAQRRDCTSTSLSTVHVECR